MSTTQTLSPTKRQLVVFDVEGVILPKNRYLIFEVGRNLGPLQTLSFLFFGLLYQIGLLSLKAALKNIYWLFRDVSLDELVKAFGKVPLLPHTEEVFLRLKQQGFRTAMISSGIPQVLVENLATRVRADYAFGLQLEISKNKLTGKIGGDVLEKQGKLIVLKRILEKERLTAEDCIVIADDRNNASIFSPKALKVGYNPDFVIGWKSDFVVCC